MERKQYENKILRPKVIKLLKQLGWHVEITHMGMYQQGWPDLYCMHPDDLPRWVELKAAWNSMLRPSQKEKFTLWTRYKTYIWIVYRVDDIPKVFEDFPTGNWWQWLR